MTTATQRLQTPAAKTATTWDLDVAHSLAEFAVRHMMIATVKGRIGVKSGSVVFDPADPAATRIEAVLDPATVHTGMEARDAHLRSPDFFDAERHPEMSFRSTTVEPLGPAEWEVHGDLAIRGESHPVTLKVEKVGQTNDPWGKTRVGIVATTQFDRTRWGLAWNQAIEAGGVLVGDKVKVELHLELVQRA